MRYLSSAFLAVPLVVLFAAAPALAGGPRATPFLPDLPDHFTRVNPEAGFTYDGLAPSCSNAPGTTSSAFYWFAKGGSTNDVLLYFEGGGACWAPENCIYPSLYTYTQQVDVDASALDAAPGLLDTTDPDNPFKDWSIVFVPYCTGDVHWGSHDESYEDIYGLYGGQPQTIRHRGFANFQAVLTWMEETFPKPHQILVTGSSAGSYGATLAYAWVHAAFPGAKVDLLGDAGNGVVPQSFIDVAPEAWGALDNLPTFVPGVTQDELRSTSVIPDLYRALGRYYRHDKISQYTTAYDEDQIFFYNVMLNIHDPAVWLTPSPATVCAWHDGMLAWADRAGEAPNYRYYIAAGDVHTILTRPEYYTEDSTGVTFVDWLDAQEKSRGGTNGHGGIPWIDAACPECLLECPAP